MFTSRIGLLPPIAALLVTLVACDDQNSAPTTQLPRPALVVDPRLEQGRNLLRHGDYARAADQFRSLLAERPDDPAGYAGLASAALKLGNIREAVRACSTGLAVDSTATELHNTLAAAYAGDGRYALAIAALDRALRQHPDFAFGHANRGGLHFKLGQYQLAERHLRRARQLDPDNPVARRRLGELFLKTARPDSALAEIDVALRHYPTSATLHYLRGQALEASARSAPALAAFRRARQLDPGFAEAQYLTANLARRQDLPALADSALAAYRHLQDLGTQDPTFRKRSKILRASVLDSPEDPLHHVQLARFFARHGYASEALRGFAHALELNPGDLRAHNQIGRILLKGKRATGALEHFERTLQLDPAFTPALVNAGNACMILADHQRAVTYYRKALDQAPEATLVWHHLAQAHIGLAQRELAARALHRGLATDGARGRLRSAMEKSLAQLE